jgi:hypothetical protein
MNLRSKIDDLMFMTEAAGSLFREKLETGTTFNPMELGLRSDPYPIYRALREESPIHRSYLAAMVGSCHATKMCRPSSRVAGSAPTNEN